MERGGSSLDRRLVVEVGVHQEVFENSAIWRVRPGRTKSDTGVQRHVQKMGHSLEWHSVQVGETGAMLYEDQGAEFFLCGVIGGRGGSLLPMR